jgi:hypothetical protein
MADLGRSITLIPNMESEDSRSQDHPASGIGTRRECCMS